MDKLWSAWFSGLVDGEGCFAFDKRTLAARFDIGLREDDLETLKDIEMRLGCGHVSVYSKGYRRHNGSLAGEARYSLCHSGHIENLLIPLLDDYPLRSRKRGDYSLWRKAIVLGKNGGRKTNEKQIREIIEQMSVIKHGKL